MPENWLLYSVMANVILGILVGYFYGTMSEIKHNKEKQQKIENKKA